MALTQMAMGMLPAHNNMNLQIRGTKINKKIRLNVNKKFMNNNSKYKLASKAGINLNNLQSHFFWD